ncbi:hypothetical protein HGRIS_010601 [Hohenbuehelia grisea]|uniref:Uncharacterized protein n=1 Tax=Hohenbuehelia grisea TaxID=104357 RepID=A0ABR3IX74_9AGAR
MALRTPARRQPISADPPAAPRRSARLATHSPSTPATPSPPTSARSTSDLSPRFLDAPASDSGSGSDLEADSAAAIAPLDFAANGDGAPRYNLRARVPKKDITTSRNSHTALQRRVSSKNARVCASQSDTSFFDSGSPLSSVPPSPIRADQGQLAQECDVFGSVIAPTPSWAPSGSGAVVPAPQSTETYVGIPQTQVQAHGNGSIGGLYSPAETGMANGDVVGSVYSMIPQEVGMGSMVTGAVMQAPMSPEQARHNALMNFFPRFFIHEHAINFDPRPFFYNRAINKMSYAPRRGHDEAHQFRFPHNLMFPKSNAYTCLLEGYDNSMDPTYGVIDPYDIPDFDLNDISLSREYVLGRWISAKEWMGPYWAADGGWEGWQWAWLMEDGVTLRLPNGRIVEGYTRPRDEVVNEYESWVAYRWEWIKRNMEVRARERARRQEAGGPELRPEETVLWEGEDAKWQMDNYVRPGFFPRHYATDWVPVRMDDIDLSVDTSMKLY